MTLRKKIATLFAESVGEDFSTFGEQDHLRAYYLEQAGRILAIPGLKRALERDNCPDCIRCGDCQDAPPLNLGHRISTAG
jgi:hypothetical protein